MKTLISLSTIKLVLVWLLFLATNCSDPIQENLVHTSPAPYQKEDDWVGFLEESFYGASIIVPKQGSIQDAVDEAQPGQAIYIEPGIYKENVTVNKPDVTLIGLTSNNDKVVIESPAAGKNSITISESGVDILNIKYSQDDSTYSSRRATRHAKSTRGNCKVTRNEIAQGIAHYEFEVRVGKELYDVIKIHRVVREQRPFKPVLTESAVFMLHGASLSFESIFLKPGTSDSNPQTSAAFYMASKNVDVWGMDFAWTLVPLETTDFTFMKDWGVERDVDHALAGMSAARLIRGLTSQGLDRMNLLGYSYGVIVAYAASGRETQQHRILRDVKGIVAIDQVMKYAAEDEEIRRLACNAAAFIKRQIDNGMYHGSGGITFNGFGTRATTAPDGTSPFPNLNNYQAGLFIGTNTFALPNPTTPYWHFVSGVFDANNMPTGLMYSDPTRWFNLAISLPPYQPQLTTYESRSCICNETDVSIDDHLGKISLPILYIGAGGAFGTLGDYTSSLTQSKDITNYTVSLNSDRRIDFGHGDLFIGNDADDLVWKVLHQWLLNHNSYSFL
jgi:hypothetical protein